MNKLKIAGVSFKTLELGDHKLLLQSDYSKKNQSIPLIGEYISKEYKEHITNIVASENELLIYTNGVSKQKLFEQLEKVSLQKLKTNNALFKIDVCFELGADWDDVTSKTNKNKEQIIKLITASQYPLINYGFQPGFMYLDKLQKSIHVPRKDKPRLKVPTGSLGIGGKYIGIYGSESPGGWHLIGRTSHRIDNEKHFSKFPSIGQKIQFIRLDEGQYLRKYNNEA